MQTKLLITGCHRSGTSLLASMVGAHKDIALVNEDYYDSYTRIFSKKYIGTKAVIPTILMFKKRSKISISLYRKFEKYISPLRKGHVIGMCNYSMNDFDKIIFISRDREANIESIINRTGVKRKYAERDVKLAETVKAKLKKQSNVFFVQLSELTADPEKSMRGICEFLEIPFQEDMLSGFKYTRRYKNTEIKKKN